MNFIEHRGGWTDLGIQYQNTEQAFLKSLSRGNGIELDLYSFENKLVISHDIPSKTKYFFSDFVEILPTYNLPLALNIKSDGLSDLILNFKQIQKNTKFFTFDMSIPDMVHYINKDLYPYIRQSDIECLPSNHSPFLYEKSQGVLIDQFFEPKSFENWINIKMLEYHINKGKEICIIAPELHSWGKKNEKPYCENAWSHLKKVLKHFSKDYPISLCTDYPIKAKDFFNE